MFARYTQRARRAIFFARYEAGQYGSPYIETEHLLLGLLREDQSLLRMSLGLVTIRPDIRGEIERHMTLRERISTTVEVPLTAECMKSLDLAAEECERLGQQYVETGHILLGILRMEGSLAARLLQERGLKAAALREHLANASASGGLNIKGPRDEKARLKLDSFLAGLKWYKAEELIEFFGEKAQFIDVFGKRWNREEIFKGFETLFAPYAKKNATALVEDMLADAGDIFVATVLWKNAILASQERIWIHRMSFILIRENEGLANSSDARHPSTAPVGSQLRREIVLPFNLYNSLRSRSHSTCYLF